MVYKNKSLADKFKLMEIDRQIEKEEESSQDNVFPESKANMFTQFGQASDLAQFHEKETWEEKYKIALGIKDPRANFMLKRLIFDESPKTLSAEDFKMVHRELHDRLVINQERPFTTIPEAMNYVDLIMCAAPSRSESTLVLTTLAPDRHCIHAIHSAVQ